MIHLTSDHENTYELNVADDGMGLPTDFDWHDSDSLGLTLITTIVENQLDGTVDIESKKGTSFVIKFSIDHT